MKTKSLIAALLLAASSAFAQVPPYVPTNGLVGWWPFNGNANDESGNGNNGTVNGATLTSDRFGNASNAYSFDRSSIKSIDIVNSNELDSITNISISLWINISSYGQAGQAGYNHYLNKSDQNNSHQFILANNNVGLYFYYGSGSNFFQTNTLPILNQWNNLNLTYTYDGSLQNSWCRFYLNGICTDSFPTNVNLPITNYNLKIGSLGTANYDVVDGFLDDICIWNRALTQQEITALYNAQSCISNTITADGPTTFCAGNSVNLKSDVVGGTYQWKKNGVNVTSNGTSRTYKATATGSYTCVATCSGTALTSNAIQVTTKTNAFASLTASGATSFCAGDSVTLNCTNLGSNYSVQWYRTNVSIENATNYSLVVKQPGTYKVVTKNLTTGCSRISGSAITTNVNCRIANNNPSEPTSNDINEEAKTLAPELSQGVNLFPNPNNGSFKFTYEGEVEGEGTIQVINAMGQTIYQSQVTAEDNRINKEISLGDHYQKGIYIVRLLINGGQNDSRMIVQ
ncbi:MAG: LamG-like jellyroll fold domain-containing protein [Bacteroidota bacterium]|jgi:hypothetical protein